MLEILDARTCSGIDEYLHDGVAVVASGVVQRGVTIFVEVVEARMTTVQMRLDHVQ